jgi:two-component system, probable response regulator PhcQ
LRQNMERTILLVDEDERLLSGLTRALHKQPFRIYTAHNGEEAILVLRARNVDVVVSDERMPGMSGSELLNWVADNCPDVMRIVLTGHAEIDMAIRAINEVGVCYFFTKPCNEARLAVAIHKAIERKDTLEANRRMLASSQQELQELERINQEVDFQAQVISQDLQRPLERILDCCQRLEDSSQEHLDPETQMLLADAHKAAAEAGLLAAELRNIAASKER